MAAILCHYFHGLRVLEESDTTVRERDAFLLGLLGPSVFLYGGMFEKSPTAAMTAFCRQIGVVLDDLQNCFTAHSSDENTMIASYCLGGLCYCCLESEMAPFVSYGAAMLHQQNPARSVDDWKNQIESSLDIILLRYERGQLPTEFDLRKTVPFNHQLSDAVTAVYHQLAATQGWTITEDELAVLLQAGVKGIGKLNDRTLMKRQFLKRREKKQGKAGGFSSLFRNISEDEDYDYANVCEGEWQWPLETGTVRTETYFDLYERAVRQMAARFRQPSDR